MSLLAASSPEARPDPPSTSRMTQAAPAQDRTSPTTTSGGIPLRQWIVAAALLGTLCALLYGRSLGFPFTRTDDTYQLVEHSRFLADLGNLPAAFTRSFFPANGSGHYYRPFVAVTYMLDAQWAGPEPLPYHVTNVLLHFVAALLLYALARRLGFTAWFALAGAAVFVVHPSLTEAVVWTPGRGDSLLGIELLGAILLLHRYGERPSPRLLTAHLAVVLVALFTKEAAVAIPLVALAYLWIVDRENRARREPLLWLGWLAAIVVWFLCRRIAIPASLDQPPGQRFAAFFQHLPVLLVYLGKALVPLDLGVLPILRDSTWAPGAATLLPLTLAGWWLRGSNRRQFLWGLASFVLLLAPSLPVSDHLLLEIRNYAPIVVLVPAGLALARQVHDRWSSPRVSKLLTATAVALVTVLSLIAWRHADDFATPDAYTARALRTSPHCALARVNRGIFLQRNGRPAEARAQYEIGLQLDPRHPIARNNLGLIHLESGETSEAERLFRQELAVNPTYDKAHFNLALALRRQDRIDEAVRSLHEALRHNPTNTDALDALASYYAFRGDQERAARYREQLRRLTP